MGRKDEGTLDLFSEAPRSLKPTLPAEPKPLPGLGARLRLPAHRGLTLHEAQEELRAGVERGTDCPACGQHAKVYRRKINSGMAYALLLMYREFLRTGQQWIRLREVLLAHKYHTGDYTYFVHWQVLARKQEKKKDGNQSGYFCLTEKGIRFARGEERLPEAVLLYQNEQILGFSPEDISIQEALGEEFSFAELMKAPAIDRGNA